MEGERERQENDSGKERMEYVTLKHDGHVTWSTKEVTIRVTQSISTWARVKCSVPLIPGGSENSEIFHGNKRPVFSRSDASSSGQTTPKSFEKQGVGVFCFQRVEAATQRPTRRQSVIDDKVTDDEQFRRWDGDVVLVYTRIDDDRGYFHRRWFRSNEINGKRWQRIISTSMRTVISRQRIFSFLPWLFVPRIRRKDIFFFSTSWLVQWKGDSDTIRMVFPSKWWWTVI